MRRGDRSDNPVASEGGMETKFSNNQRAQNYVLRPLVIYVWIAAITSDLLPEGLLRYWPDRQDLGFH